MKQKSIGFKIGIVLALLHCALVILAFIIMLNSRSSTAGLIFLWFYFLDAPLLLVFPSSIVQLFGIAGPLIQFGIFGSGLWFLIPWLIDLLFVRIFPNKSTTTRVAIIAGTIVLLFFGFIRLSFFSTRLMVQRERPSELKKGR